MSGRVDLTLRERLDRFAKREKRSVSNSINLLLLEALKTRETLDETNTKDRHVID
jgi:hypothetical protein